MPQLRLSPEACRRFTHVPEIDRARARVVVVRAWLPGVAATTLGRWILVRRGRDRDPVVVAHELVHVRQWRELGPARFLSRYLVAYLDGRRRGLRHREAYAAIPLEAEARALAGG